MSSNKLQWGAVAVSLVLLVTLPVWLANPYYINVSSQILLFAVLALARRGLCAADSRGREAHAAAGAEDLV